MMTVAVTVGVLVGGGMGFGLWRGLPKRGRGSVFWYIIGGAAIGAMAAAYGPSFLYSSVDQ